MSIASKHNEANRKWRSKNPDYLKIWRRKNPNYISKTHGMPEYRTWCHMVNRCHSITSPQWKWYGARGIKVLYNSFNEFLKDVGKKPSNKHSINRINNDGNYEPGNVKWATATQQAANRRPYATCRV